MAAALFLIVALVLPRVSAVLVEFIPGVDTVIICTGSEYVTLTLGPDGTPIDVAESSDNRCTLSDTPELTVALQPFWHQLARGFQHPFKVVENGQSTLDRLAHLEPSRAPPAVI
ncbi:hypothetical protein NBRC116601_27190 [Cognatishimia sp. WU-CL00825]